MLRNAYVKMELPYFSLVSVNAAYNRNNPRQGIKRDVETWLTALVSKLNKEIRHSKMLNIEGDIRMDITLCLPPRPIRKGRNPDTSNFRKVPQDCIAEALGVDDSIFYGTDHPVTIGDDTMIIELSWTYRTSQPDAPIGHDSALAMGPLSSAKGIAKLLGIEKDKYCIGFASAYCMWCSAIEYCPAEYSPEVYSSVPCIECDISNCPCKKADGSYDKRKEEILLWWRSKQ